MNALILAIFGLSLAPTGPLLAQLSWLAGEWSGAGTGTPGEATGGFTFSLASLTTPPPTAARPPATTT